MQVDTVVEGMSRILQKAAVQRGARGCCPSRTRSTEWVWVYRYRVAATCQSVKPVPD